jgi:RimJ/RimL family protein N-acetyltransferase
MHKPVTLTVSGSRAFSAIEPTIAAISRYAVDLATAYNYPGNAQMMGNQQTMTSDDVIAYYREMADSGARQFLLFVDEQFVGDADLRDIHDGAAEFAFMIAAPSSQGQGLGTVFADMLHQFAFTQLGLIRLYVAIVPSNVASRRVFEKLGYQLDHSPAARSRADEDDDITMSISAAAFEAGKSRRATQSVIVAARTP